MKRKIEQVEDPVCGRDTPPKRFSELCKRGTALLYLPPATHANGPSASSRAQEQLRLLEGFGVSASSALHFSPRRAGPSDVLSALIDAVARREIMVVCVIGGRSSCRKALPAVCDALAATGGLMMYKGAVYDPRDPAHQVAIRLYHASSTYPIARPRLDTSGPNPKPASALACQAPS